MKSRLISGAGVKAFFLFFLLVLSALHIPLSAGEVPAGDGVPSGGAGDAPQKTDESVLFDGGFLESTDIRKHYLTGIGGMLLADSAVFLLDKYIIRYSFSDATFDTIKTNFTSPPVFDVSLGLTNFIGHPYQGSVSYLMGRSSNLNVLESFLLSAAGSAIWEYFCEASLPSINDLVFTPVGGFALGEMLYRLSLEAAGRGRTVLSFIANPSRLFTDPVLGHGPRGAYGFLKELSLRAGFGIAYGRTSWGDRLEDAQNDLYPFYGLFGFHALYGDPYDNDSNTPYSQFELQADLSLGVGSGHAACHPESPFLTSAKKYLMYNADIFSDGTIISRNAGKSGNTDTTLALSMSYDVMCHSFMEFSSLAPSFAVKQRVSFDGAGAFSWQAHAGIILMGAQDFYFTQRGLYTPAMEDNEPFRSYGYTTGAAFKGKFNWTGARGLTLDAFLRGYAMYTYSFGNGESDRYNDTGWALFALLTARAELPLTAGVSVGCSDDFYIKFPFYDGNMQGYPSSQRALSAFNAFNVYVRYSFSRIL